MLQLPTLGLAASYSATGSAAEGMVSKEMNAVIALYLLVWGFAMGTFFLFTIRINLVFAGIFGFVTVGAWVLSGAYWALSNGHFDKALKLQKVSDWLIVVDRYDVLTCRRRVEPYCSSWHAWDGICCSSSWLQKCGGRCVPQWET